MSTNARKYGHDRDFKRRTRTKRTAHLLALVRVSTVNDTGERIVCTFEIRRRRVRGERFCAAHIGHHPGADGYYWSCNCSESDGKGRAFPSHFAPDKKPVGWRGSVCTHLSKIRSGLIPEGTIPSIDERFVVELTKQGADVLRLLWATDTLARQ